jgi:hypothetical protein
MLGPFAGSEAIEAVFLTCFRNEYVFLATVLQYSRIRMHRAETLEEADFLLTVSGSTVLLTDALFLDGTWRDALRMAAEMHPFTGCLVVADAADWRSLGDLYALGGCGALEKPADPIVAIRLIRTVDEAARNRRFIWCHQSMAEVEH